MLKPALRRAWRGRDTVQFGVTRAHAVKLGPVDVATGSFLELLDGTRGLTLLREEARTLDLSDHQVDTLVRRLANAGLIDDVRAGGPEAAALRNRADVLERQRPDLASLSVIHPEPGGGMRRLAARRAMRVQVRGAGRVGAAIAAVLSGSEWAGSRSWTAGSPSPPTSRRAAFRQRRSASAGTPQPGSWSAARPPAPLRGRRGRRTPRRVARQRVAQLRVVGPGCRWSWSPLGTVSRCTPRPPRRRTVDRVGHSSSLCRGDRGHRCGRPPGPARGYGLRGMPGADPRGPGSAVAKDADAVAVRATQCRAGVRPGARDSGGRSRRSPCAGFSGRRTARQHGGQVGGCSAAVGLEVGAGRGTPRLFLRGWWAH